MSVPLVRLLLCVYSVCVIVCLPCRQVNIATQCVMANRINDVNVVMALFKEAAEDYGDSGKNSIAPYLLHGLRVMVDNIFERQDNSIKDLKEDYEKQLDDKQKVIDDKLQVIDDLNCKIIEQGFENDALGQYNRLENIKIHGVEYKGNESVVEITKEIGKYSGVKIEDGDISCGHRLMSKSELDKRAASTNKSDKIPQLIVRFNRRDVKDKLLTACKNIQYNVECPQYLKNVRIYEDVTPLRSRIMYHLRQKDDKKAFKFVWSRGGRIYVRTHEEAAANPQPKPHLINNPYDMLKVGFTKSEVDAIIKGNSNNH